MKRKILVLLIVPLIVIPMLSAPSYASATWGVETETTYKFSLKTFTLLQTDYSAFIKASVGIEVEFTEFNSTGYVYDVYNTSSSELITTNSTNFEVVEMEGEDYIVPNGLPIALPLQYGEEDYLEYIGTMVNVSASLIGFEDILNVTEFGDVEYLMVYSLLDTSYLKLRLDLYSPEVDTSMLGALLGDDSPLPIPLPETLTEFTLNATLAFNATIGLLDSLRLNIDSISEEIEGYPTDFDVDLVYSWDMPQPPAPPTNNTDDTNETSEAPYSWVMSFTGPLILLGLMVIVRRRQ